MTKNYRILAAGIALMAAFVWYELEAAAYVVGLAVTAFAYRHRNDAT